MCDTLFLQCSTNQKEYTMAKDVALKTLYKLVYLLNPEADTTGDKKISRAELAEAAEKAVQKAEKKKKQELALR